MTQAVLLASHGSIDDLERPRRIRQRRAQRSPAAGRISWPSCAGATRP
jgi:hypothetical protein